MKMLHRCPVAKRVFINFYTQARPIWYRDISILNFQRGFEDRFLVANGNLLNDIFLGVDSIVLIGAEMQMGYSADCGLDIVHRDGPTERGSHCGDLLHLGKSTCLDDVGLHDIHLPLQNQVREVLSGVDTFAGSYGHGQGPSHLRQSFQVVVGAGFFKMKGAQVFQCFANLYGTVRRESPVYVYQDWIPVAHRPSHFPHVGDNRLSRVIKSGGHCVVQFVAFEALFGELRGTLGFLQRSQCTSQRTGVNWYLISDLAAEQLVNRHSSGLTANIP